MPSLSLSLSRPLTPLLLILPILMLDAIIEVGFVGSTVGFLHDRAGKWFDVSPPNGSPFELHGKPAGLLVDQGHASNGAAGTAFVLIGIGGLLAIYLQRRQHARQTSNNAAPPTPVFTFWVVMTIVSNALTLAALIYVFVLTYNHNHQTIDLSVAAANPEPIKYPLDHWTPENWFDAIIDQVPLTHDSDRRKINQELRLMRGWRWNLIPLFVLGSILACTAVWEWLKLRRSRPTTSASRKPMAEGSAF